MTDTIGRGVIELSADSGKLNAAINDARRSIKSLGDDAGKVSKGQSASIDKYVRSLQTAAAVQGKSTRETELYRLALRGATDEQLRAANSALRLSDAYQRGEVIGTRIRLGMLAFAGAAAAAGAASIALFNASAKSIDGFNDLKDATGASIENISALDDLARRTGASFETVETSLIKFNAALKNAKPDSDAARAFEALNLNVKELRELDPAEAFRRTAVALAGFADDGNKARLVQELFGKSLKEVAPLLKDLSEKGQLVATVTTAQAEAAETYRKNIFALEANVGNLARSLTNDLIPALNNAFTKAQQFSSIGNFFASFGQEFKANIASDKLRVLTADIEKLDAYMQKNPGNPALERRMREMREEATKLSREASAASEELKRLTGGAPIAANDGSFDRAEAARLSRVPKPSVNVRDAVKKDGSIDKAAREAEQVRRAELENDLKFLRDKLGEERDTIAFHQRELSQLYQAGAISLREFYDQRNKEISDGVQRELNLLTDEQARLEVELSQVSDPSERIKLQGKLDEAVQRSSKVVVDAARAASISNREEAESFKQLSEQVQNFKANLLAAQGDTAGAAAIRNADAIRQVRDLQDRAKGSANPISDAQVNAQIAALNQTEAINAAKDRTSQINQRLAIEEDRIALAQKTGATTELGALAAIGEARSKIVGEMEKQVEELERIAKERPLDIQLTIDASRARLELDKLKADLDPLKEKFDNMFKGAGANALADFFNGKTSLLGSIKAFGAQVATNLTNTIAQEISETAFGKGGIFGDVGGIVAGLFGGGKKGATSPAIDTSSVTASLATLQTSGVDPTTSALTRLAQAADGAAAKIDPTSAQTSGAVFDQTKTGEASIADLFKPTQESQEEASRSASLFADNATTASAQLARLAASASSGGGALSLLPSIISAIASASAASSAGGGGGGGAGIWGSLFDAAASYFTGGYSYNGGVGTTNAAGISGGRAGGGMLSPNRIHPVNETGRPELLTTRGGSQYLMPVPGGGTVTPASSGPQAPVVMNFHFKDSKPGRETMAQVAASAQRGIRAGSRNT